MFSFLHCIRLNLLVFHETSKTENNVKWERERERGREIEKKKTENTNKFEFQLNISHTATVKKRLLYS